MQTRLAVPIVAPLPAIARVRIAGVSCPCAELRSPRVIAMAGKHVAAAVQAHTGAALRIETVEHTIRIGASCQQAFHAPCIHSGDTAVCVRLTDGNDAIVHEVRSSCRRLLPCPQPVRAVPCRESRAEGGQFVVGVPRERRSLPACRVAVAVEGEGSALCVLVSEVEGLCGSPPRCRVGRTIFSMREPLF